MYYLIEIYRSIHLLDQLPASKHRLYPVQNKDSRSQIEPRLSSRPIFYLDASSLSKPRNSSGQNKCPRRLISQQTQKLFRLGHISWMSYLLENINHIFVKTNLLHRHDTFVKTSKCIISFIKPRSSYKDKLSRSIIFWKTQELSR